MALQRGRPGARPLKPGATIPISQTSPALNLTALFNGFQPLFAALDPKQVNQLSLNLVRTLQGEGGTMQSLLGETASLTSSLADRDRLVGQVIGNLNVMLRTVDTRHRQLNQLVTGLEKWMGQLARDRHTIGDSVQNVSRLTGLLADLLTRGRPMLKADVAQLRQLATRLAQPRNRQLVTKLLDFLPGMLTDQTRTGTYGAWYNYYLCDFKGRITLPALKGPGVRQLEAELENITFHSTAARCQR
jgi:phospholipid/cholesterol/gamma-HCH transport system substrate-binding protein